MGATGDETAAMMRTLLKRLEVLAFDEIGQILDEHAVFDFPFRRTDPTVTGREAIVAHLKQGMGNFLKSINFQIHAQYPCEDPEMMIAEYSSTGVLANGGHYQNRYVGIFRVRKGKILLFREYYNPLLTAAGR